MSIFKPLTFSGGCLLLLLLECIPSWELSHIPSQERVDNDFPFPKVEYVIVPWRITTEKMVCTYRVHYITNPNNAWYITFGKSLQFAIDLYQVWFPPKKGPHLMIPDIPKPWLRSFPWNPRHWAWIVSLPSFDLSDSPPCRGSTNG